MHGVIVIGNSHFPISEIQYIESLPDRLRVYLKNEDAVDVFMSQELAETVLERFNEIHSEYIEYALGAMILARHLKETREE